MKNGTGSRWMVVDSDAHTLETVATLLRVFTDAEICPFKSTTDALDAFVAAPDTYQMVITDFDMPKLNAVDFRRHLQALAPGLKVFVITGSGMFTEENARRGGFCGLLRKPFTLGALKRAVECAQSDPIGQSYLTYPKEKGHKMKTTTMLALLALSASALLANAQDFGGPPPDGNQGPPGMGSGNGSEEQGHRRSPPNVLMDALDTNHDGIIDSNEIANASAALKKLDKNGDGRLTPDELRPQRPPRPGGNHRGPGPDNQDRPPRNGAHANGQGGPPGPDQQMPPHPDGPPPQPGGPPGN